MKTWLFFILAIIASDSFANDWWLDVHLASYHFNRDGYYQDGEQHDWNEKNFGLGVTYQYHENVQLMGGFFDNSYHTHSNYAAINFHANYNIKSLIIKPGVLIGGVTGYEDTPMNENSWVRTVTPMAGPNLSIGTKKLLLNIGLIPIEDMGITFTLKIKI